MTTGRALVLVLDSFGLGAAPDAARFGDDGANTYGHIAAWCAQQRRPLRLPNLLRLGLAHAAQACGQDWPAGVTPSELATPTLALYGAAAELSRGKDTPSGHWELMGCPVSFDWGYFQANAQGVVFPPALMQEWLHAAGLAGSLGNCHASGTEIIQQWGDEHVRSGWPICYTSADSVLQIAAHEQSFGLERLYRICELAQPIFDRINIARIIARPFEGSNGQYRRTARRHDYTRPPPAETLLDRLLAQGREVHAVGKISDIFAGRGISHVYHGDGNLALLEQTRLAWARCPPGGLVFTNLVDFDTLYGHRRDLAGYAAALEQFDLQLPSLMRLLGATDLLAITADHGCDPSWRGSDHTREFVPLLLAGPACQTYGSGPIGRRQSFADLGQSLARHLQVGRLPHGQVVWES